MTYCGRSRPEDAAEARQQQVLAERMLRLDLAYLQVMEAEGFEPQLPPGFNPQTPAQWEESLDD